MNLKGIIKGLLDKTPKLWVGLAVCPVEDRLIFFGPHRERAMLLEIVHEELNEMVHNKPCHIEYFNWPKAKNKAIAWLMKFGVEEEMATLFAAQIDGYCF